MGQADVALKELGHDNVTLLDGDGTLGDPSHAPFDRIIIIAAARIYPPPLFDQLVEGGILLAPLGGSDCQTPQRIRKTDGIPIRKS
jgi:protein-L-isoaspartate(D-aspartate) O-methyltransferase